MICDRDDLVALFIPGGASYKDWMPHWSSADRVLGDRQWPVDVVRLMFPDRWHSVWVFLQRLDGTRQFNGYYVNFEEPFRRTAIGFDTNDHTLDIVVTPELTWTWKDAEDFDAPVRDGIYSGAFAAAIRSEADRVIDAIESCGSPFSDGWDRWAPNPAWTVPILPSVWDTEPVAVWEHRRWAYPSAR